MTWFNKAKASDGGQFGGTGASGDWQTGIVTPTKSATLAAAQGPGYDASGVAHTHTTDHTADPSLGAYTPALPATPTQSPSLAQDPSYLAYMRELGISTEEAQRSAQDRIDSMNNLLGRNLSDISAAGELTRQGLANRMEERGLLSSGEFLTNQANQRAAQARQEANLRATNADQIATLQNDLARQIAVQNANASNQALTAAGNTFSG